MIKQTNFLKKTKPFLPYPDSLCKKEQRINQPNVRFVDECRTEWLVEDSGGCTARITENITTVCAAEENCTLQCHQQHAKGTGIAAGFSSWVFFSICFISRLCFAYSYLSLASGKAVLLSEGDSKFQGPIGREQRQQTLNFDHSTIIWVTNQDPWF